MRLVIQGSLTPTQLGKAVGDMVQNTLEKANVEGKRYVIHNPVVEFSLNIKGHEQPQLLIDEERGHMLTIHTGYKNGEFTEYVPINKDELLEKFNRMVDEGLKEMEKMKNETAETTAEENKVVDIEDCRK